MRVICNSSPLIAFDCINRVNILQQLFDTIIIPEAVYEEVYSKADKNIFSPDFIRVEKIKDNNTVKLLELQLDRGESEVITLAMEKEIHISTITINIGEYNNLFDLSIHTVLRY